MVSIIAITLPLGAALLFVYLIVLIRRRKYASLAKSMLAAGIVTGSVNTVIGATHYNPGDVAGFVVLFWLPVWGFFLGAFAGLVAWLLLSRMQLTVRAWALVGAAVLLVAIAAAIPFDSTVVPAVRLTLVDESGASVPAACAIEFWSYDLLNNHFDGDDHRADAEGRVTLPARVVHISAMSRLANFWILGRPYLLNPYAKVNVFSTDSGQHYLVAHVDPLRVRELRLIMRPDIYAFDHPGAWNCGDTTRARTALNPKHRAEQGVSNTRTRGISNG